MKPTNYNEKSARILDLLTEGDATAREIAWETGTDVQHSSALLCHLRRMGAVKSHKVNISTGGRPAQLWSLNA